MSLCNKNLLPMLTSDFIGHFHPLIVHLPIGILLFAALLTFVAWIKSWDIENVILLAWGTGAFFAIFACITGWILGQSGDYDTALLAQHQWTGLLTAGLSTGTFLIKRYRWIPASATIIFLSIAGHFGGTLTHGENFLFSKKSESAEAVEATDSLSSIQQGDTLQLASKPILTKTFIYQDQVTPILKAKCYSCHGPSKKKGGLRLDSEAHIKSGGKNGKIITTGNPGKSPLYTYLLLPEGDEKHMPPKGKLQLTPREINTIRQWIAKGASFQEEIEEVPSGQGIDISSTFAVVEHAFPESTPRETNQPISPISKDTETLILANKQPPADPLLIGKLKQQQIVLNEVLAGSDYWSVNLVNVKKVTPALLDDLGGMEQHIMRLKMSDKDIEDSHLKQLKGFKNLTRLNLENSNITDQGLEELAHLPQLEQLNLYGTKITDAGLAKLANYPNLKMVYVWQTQTSEEGFKSLQKARPDLKIETGQFQLIKPDTSKINQK
jgi:uncharacterized membrane protein